MKITPEFNPGDIFLRRSFREELCIIIEIKDSRYLIYYFDADSDSYESYDICAFYEKTKSYRSDVLPIYTKLN